MRVFIFGNGNLSFENFQLHYQTVLDGLTYDDDLHFVLGEFRGADILALEYLKTRSANVTLLHMRDRPRYLPDKFRTMVRNWEIVGGFKNDLARDEAATERCTHFLGVDFNSDEKRVSGSQKNINRCLGLGKIRLGG